jgi:FAD synthetase
MHWQLMLRQFLHESPRNELRRNTQERVRQSLIAVEESLRQFELRQIAVSFNGGKDCLAMLILLLACLGDQPVIPSYLHAVFVTYDRTFPEIDDFVQESATACHLELVKKCMPLKEAFGDYLEERNLVKAVFVGTRRTDPHGANLKTFDKTDHGWPSFIRIHPVLDWHYVEIWDFLRAIDVPICSLYERGYTSLGAIDTTHPNPALYDDGSYKPAWLLERDDEERLGRE